MRTSPSPGRAVPPIIFSPEVSTGRLGISRSSSPWWIWFQRASPPPILPGLAHGGKEFHGGADGAKCWHQLYQRHLDRFADIEQRQHAGHARELHRPAQRFLPAAATHSVSREPCSKSPQALTRSSPKRTPATWYPNSTEPIIRRSSP